MTNSRRTAALALLLTAIMLFSSILAACGKSDTDGDGKSTESADSDSLGDNAAQDYGYEWALEPSVEADDIHPVNVFYNDYYCDYIGYNIIETQNGEGIISYDGEVVLEPGDYNLFYCLLHNVISDTSNQSFHYDPYSKKQFVNEFLCAHDYGVMFDEYLYYGGTVFKKLEYGAEMRVDPPQFCVVENADVNDDPAYSGEFDIIGDGRYGILADGKIVVPFDYDYGTNYSEDIACLGKDGEYSYFDKAGNPIFAQTFNSHYSASYGAIALCNDGKWGFADTSGEMLTPMCFDEARPVFNTLAWVKQDGKWGVVRLTDPDLPGAVRDRGGLALTPEEAVDIYMANKDVWMEDSETPAYALNYLLLDLDFDGVLELVSNYYFDTLEATENKYYRIAGGSRKVFKISETTDFYLSQSVDINGRYGTTLMKDAGGNLFYYSSNYSDTFGGGGYNHDFVKIYLSEGKLVCEKVHSDGYGLVSNENEAIGADYFIWVENGNEVDLSEEDYNSRVANFKSENKDMGMKYGTVGGGSFDELSDSYQRKLLLDAYCAFSYDGFKFEKNAEDEPSSSKDLALTPEEAVDIYMANKDMWMISEDNFIYDDPVPYSAGYVLIDLDFDGVLELLTNECVGRVASSENHYYRIDLSSRNVVEIPEDDSEVNGLYGDFDIMSKTSWSLDSTGNDTDTKAIRLRKDPEGKLFYMSCECGWYAFGNDGMNVGKLLYSSGMIESESVYSKWYYGEGNMPVDGVEIMPGDHYYWEENGEIVEIGKDEYDARVAQFYADNPSMGLNYSDVKGETFALVSPAEQRDLLLDAYLSFSYDGFSFD